MYKQKDRIDFVYDNLEIIDKLEHRNQESYPTKKSYVLAAITAFDEEKNDSGQEEISPSALEKISEDHKKIEELLEQILNILEEKKKEEGTDLFEDATQFFE